jgi:hypothetical protein
MLFYDHQLKNLSTNNADSGDAMKKIVSIAAALAVMRRVTGDFGGSAMRRIGSKSVDGLIVRFVRTPHTMFFRPGRALACTLVLATVLSAVELGSAYAGSVTIRTYQYNYRSGGGGFSWGGGGGGGGCPAGEGYCGGGCAPTGSTFCTNGRYCAGNQICTNNGNSCLDRSDERVCSDGRVCGPGFLCMKDDSCLSMASDRYCGNRHYCDMGYVCQPGGGCRTQASIDAEANLRAEQEREEQERAQQRLEEQERAQQRREEHEAPPGGQTNFAQPGSSPLDSLANGICPTNSQSDVTGLGGSSAPTLLPPKPNCKLPGAGFGEPYDHSQQTIHYTRWNGDDLPIPPGFGLWLQDGLLEVQQVDAAHPADIQPKGGATPDGCMPPAAYESGSAAATGWVSLGCQMGASGINCNGFVRTRFAKPTAFGTERLFIQTETQ